MSLKSRDARRLAVAGLTTIAAFGAATSTASAAKLTLNYACKYPLIGVQPLKIDIDAAIPSSLPSGQEAPSFVINAVATAGGSTAAAMQLIGAQTLEGSAKAKATLTNPGGSKLPINVPISVATWTRAGATVPAPLVLNAQGFTPEIGFDDAGTANVTVDSLALTLTARNAAGQALPLNPVTKDLDGNPFAQGDSDPGTFDVPCKLDPASQSTKLATINVTDGGGSPSTDTTAPSKPGNVKANALATSAQLSWNAATDNSGAVTYDVLRGTSRVARVDKTSVTVQGLTASTAYQFTVVARDAAGNTTSSDPVSVTTPAGGTNLAAIAKYNAALAGSATMRTLITGNLPLEGGIAADMKIADGTYTADLTLLPRTGRLNALGFLPVTARVGFTNSGKTVGNIDADQVLTATAKLRIKLLDVKLFGAISIAGGNNCQTKQISTIVLKSKPNFDPIAGGAISGTFSISDLNDCGFLTGIVSPLTAGGGNLINATLKPQL